MRHIREIIIAPIFTEKASTQLGKHNSYSFRVSTIANKIEIKRAIEKIFSVVVTDVNTINMRGKVKRVGRHQGKKADWKKAIVTLKEGHSIPDFEV
ncbi:MAG: 50S ribosomal protein L23 [Candidatus Cloacimonas sp.]|jgi:large subunit ribosomal protein L23|nr:50S ribosomal protein L23 [Candidatus Cloacimonadota bacterium]